MADSQLLRRRYDCFECFAGGLARHVLFATVLVGAPASSARWIAIKKGQGAVMTRVQFIDAGKMLVIASIALFYPLAIFFALVFF